MAKNPHFDFTELRPARRLQLALDLWDSVDPTAGVDVLPLTAEQRAELDRRLEDLESNPGDSAPWPEERDRLLVRASVTERTFSYFRAAASILAEFVIGRNAHPVFG